MTRLRWTPSLKHVSLAFDGEDEFLVKANGWTARNLVLAIPATVARADQEVIYPSHNGGVVLGGVLFSLKSRVTYQLPFPRL